jgi:hypothetical protein
MPNRSSGPPSKRSAASAGWRGRGRGRRGRSLSRSRRTSSPCPRAGACSLSASSPRSSGCAARTGGAGIGSGQVLAAVAAGEEGQAGQISGERPGAVGGMAGAGEQQDLQVAGVCGEPAGVESLAARTGARQASERHHSGTTRPRVWQGPWGPHLTLTGALVTAPCRLGWDMRAAALAMVQDRSADRCLLLQLAAVFVVQPASGTPPADRASPGGQPHSDQRRAAVDTSPHDPPRNPMIMTAPTAATGTRADEDLMTRRQVASLFRVTSAAVASWGRRGRLLEVRTPAGRPRYRRAEVEALYRRGSRRAAR